MGVLALAANQPVLDGLKLILRFADSKTTFFPPGVAVVLDGVVKADWREFAVSLDPRGGERIVRLVYECGVSSRRSATGCAA